jgi:hypothetical protein
MATSEAIVGAWERGLREHPLDRALTLLEAFAGIAREDAARYPVGRRDALLIDARVAVYGRQFDGYAACGACGTGMECSFPLPQIAADEVVAFTLPLGPRQIAVRLPDSRDLAAIAHCANGDEAAALLLERCTGGLVGPADAAADALDTLMSERCAATLIDVALACPECATPQSVAFDIGQAFWLEVSAHARRLLREVDVLARRYGWNDREVLRMSEARRHYFLELGP